MQHDLTIAAAALDALAADPERTIEGRLNGCRYVARIAIPHYAAKVARHYAELAPGGLAEVCRRTDIAFDLPEFGFVCDFDSAIEIAVHADDDTLAPGLRDLVHRFGPVILRNAYLPAGGRKVAQRNIFAHLNFHFDRGANQPTQYSLFSRNPFDAEQRPPRRSSTVHAANIVAHLQYAREQRLAPDATEWRGRYDIFQQQDMSEVIGSVVLEHAWDAPEGTGEICVLFNRTVLHASYYRSKDAKGYPIGVRYLK